MLKKFAHISLMLLLLITIIGIRSTKVYCAEMGKTIAKKCCDKKDENGKECCQEVKVYYRVESNVVVPSNIQLPDYFTFAIVYFTFNNLNSVAIAISDLLYIPPLHNRDIPILVSCFRI